MGAQLKVMLLVISLCLVVAAWIGSLYLAFDYGGTLCRADVAEANAEKVVEKDQLQGDLAGVENKTAKELAEVGKNRPQLTREVVRYETVYVNRSRDCADANAERLRILNEAAGAQPGPGQLPSAADDTTGANDLRGPKGRGNAD